MSTHPPLVRTRLSLLMFLEFFIWGSWGFALGGYAGKLGLTGGQTGWLLGVPAFGAIISPLFMGAIADRYFAAQKVLAVLHVISGIGLFCAARVSSFPLLMTCMMVHGLCFMPTIALANSVAFRHIPDASKFPRIAVFGTIGWIVSVLVADVALGGMSSPGFLVQAGVASIVLGLYSLSLPHTPPKGAEAGGSALGLNALTMLKDPQLLIFIACVFLVSIPACGYFFTLAGQMLQQRGYPAPLALTTLNQFSELLFMFLMPVFVATLGLKRTLLIGMSAWGIRYLLFMGGQFSLDLVGLLLHGFCYSFLYVGAYMYVDKRAPAELKASAQSLLSFLLLGLGWLFGAKAAGFMLERYPAPVPGVEVVAATETQAAVYAMPAWSDPALEKSAFRFLDLSRTIKGLLGSGGEGDAAAAPAADFRTLADADKDGRISLSEIRALPETGITVGGTTYPRAGLVRVFGQISETLGLQGPEIRLTRQDWLRAQSRGWKPIWLYPAIFILVVMAFFAVACKPEDTAAVSPDAEPESAAS